jgi:hypothetical protein
MTAHGTFWTKTGNFLNRSLFPKLQTGIFNVFTFANSDTNWHWTVSCTAAPEQNRIMLGINEFRRSTTIRMVRHNSPPRGDYVHITGENSGCWSFVGRIGGVSNTAQGVVKKSPALRTANLGFNSQPLPQKTQTHYGLSRITPHNLVNNSRTLLSELQ